MELIRQRGKREGVLNALLHVIFVKKFLIQDSKYLKAFPQAEPIRLTKTCLRLPKMLFTWPRVINAIYST